MFNFNSEKPIIFYLNQLSVEDIERYLILNDNNLYEKLSDRLNIHEYSKKLYKNALHFTLYEQDNLVGFSPCYFNDQNADKAYISALIIRKSHQHLGLNKRLLEYIKTYAKQNSFRKISVSFHCKNEVSIAFYTKNGFVKIEQDDATNLCVFECPLK